MSKRNFFDYYGKLNFEIRNLLREAFYHFNSKQKGEIIDIVSNLKVKGEIHIWNNNGQKVLSSQWGLTKYMFIKCLPKETIQEDPRLKKQFNELQRRFGDLEDSSGSRSWGGAVHAPLTINAYKKMTVTDWLKSFKKYNSEDRLTNYNNPGDFLKGGLIEHSRAFADAVKSNPAKHLQIISDAFDDPDIPIDYTIRGIDGLRQANFDTNIILELLKKVIKRNLDLSNCMYCIWIIDDLIRRDCVDSDLVDYLIIQTLQNPNPEKEFSSHAERQSAVREIISSGINSGRGAAAKVLVRIQDKTYEELIFETLGKVFRNDFNQVRAAAIFQIAYLMNVNKERTFDLFLSAIEVPDSDSILSSGIWSVQYLIHYDFEKLIPYFKRITRLKDLGSEDINSLSTILFAAWLNDYPHASSLFSEFLEEHHEAASKAIRDSFDNFYFKGKKSKKAISILKKMTDYSDKEIVHSFQIAFLHLEDIKFTDISPFLFKYVQSKSFKIGDYFLQYLIANCNQDILTAIDIFELAVKNKNGLEDYRNYAFHYEESATKFIVGAFNQLRPNHEQKHLRYQTKLLKAFDKILKDDRYKIDAENVLEKIIE